MKIAFPSLGKELGSMLDDRFGRAERFLVIDTATKSIEIIENAGGQDSEHGAGINAAQLVVDAGAEAVVASHCGPKAFKVFEAAKVVVLQGRIASIADLLAEYAAGSLVEMAGPRKAGLSR